MKLHSLYGYIQIEDETRILKAKLRPKDKVILGISLLKNTSFLGKRYLVMVHAKFKSCKNGKKNFMDYCKV